MSLTDRCAGPVAGRLTLEAALARMLAVIEPLAACEQVGLKAARGRILAEDIATPFDLPPFPSSAMDGYALHRDDLPGGRRLRLAGTSLAGHPHTAAIRPGECIRVFTGAWLPEATAAVVAQEDVRLGDGSIRLDGPVTAGDYTRPQGDDSRAGAPLLAAGRLLAPADLGLLAAIGRIDVAVRCRPRVAFLSTGDELRPTWAPLGPGQIHDSNRYVLDASLEALGVEPLDLGCVPDDPEAFAAVLQEASARADALVTTGGASVGDADYLVRVVQSLGRLDFWKVAVKPGKPFGFGRIGECWLFGLPGNPVAVTVTFRQLVRPALLRLMGAHVPAPLRMTATCLNRLHKAAGRLEFQRGLYRRTAEGAFEVKGLAGQGSHRLTSLSGGNCYIVLPLACTGHEPGDRVDIEPFDLPSS